ncbi:hypothetical protein [Aureimonas glaciei]|uniref:hypothetical protein n=1 Tax=Aureimonas glaciei TaxID=1776957 RepID=UPI00166CAA45|nr:hypothetical protein [Aureimonas glaciei]
MKLSAACKGQHIIGCWQPLFRHHAKDRDLDQRKGITSPSAIGKKILGEFSRVGQPAKILVEHIYSYCEEGARRR